MEPLTAVVVSAVAAAAMALFGAFAAAFGVDTRPGFDGRPIDR